MTPWYTQVWRTEHGDEFDTGWTTKRPVISEIKPFRFAQLIMIVSAFEKRA